MWTRGSGVLALAFALLLASTVGLVGHDHAVGIARSSYECTVDHEQAHAPGLGDSEPTVRASGSPHRHHCLGCQTTGQRLLLASPAVAVSPVPASTRSIEIRSLPQISKVWTGRTLRGPPST